MFLGLSIDSSFLSNVAEMFDINDTLFCYRQHSDCPALSLKAESTGKTTVVPVDSSEVGQSECW